MHHPEESCAGYSTRQTSDHTRLQINCECITEALGHESNLVIIGREVSAFAKVCENLDITGKMIQGVANLPLGESRIAQQQDSDSDVGHNGMYCISTEDTVLTDCGSQMWTAGIDLSA